MESDFYLAAALRNDVYQLPQMLEACVEKYMTENGFRVYIKPTEFSEHAKTFKVIKTKKRKEKGR